MNYVKQLASVALLLFAQSIFAISYPKGCEVDSISFLKKTLTINPIGLQTFYLFYNDASHTMRLDYIKPNKHFLNSNYYRIL